MKITHISASDFSGGAARAAFRLHTGLRRLGVNSQMFVGHRESSDDAVTTYSPNGRLPERLLRGLRHRVLQREIARYQSRRPAGATFFSDDRTGYGGALVRQTPSADLLNLHWVAGLVDYGSFFRALSRDIPLVWTLHDMNPFTGGCHYTGGCGRFEQRCGACPQLGSEEDADASRAISERKRGAYAEISPGRLRVVTPSRWLGEQARRSSLFGGFRVATIPYGLDTETFRPQDQGLARGHFGIPANAKVVLFVAQWVNELRKGFFLLPRVLETLGDDPDLRAVSIGRGGESGGGAKRVVLEYTDDERTLSLLYSAADVFLLPTVEDNFPNTALEAVACGVPVVAFRVGGVPEIVRDGVTGLLVEAGDAGGLGKAIGELLRNPERRRAMSANCRRVAVTEYGLEIQASRYVELYREMLGLSGSERGIVEKQAGWKEAIA